ncbi:hypothetical protein K2173_000654 [Erythroxylum novogranatense]|uniref:Peptidase A1 domain-containing protein n=1 Tax=Erythroxylum novogranatense TaxID=1862640 RepID=A0AAV8SIX3_9ROSI|nr:hypothetical protein K2173_000654 [Erythroxylum novogranatense]
MVSSVHNHLFTFLSLTFLFLPSECIFQPPTFKPNNLVLPVRKDGATSLHVTSIQKRTPQTPVQFVVDLNGRFLWVNCEKNYLSTTYQAPLCHSTLCVRAGSDYCHTCLSSKARYGCHNNTCGLVALNPMTHQTAVGELAQDVLAIQSTRGSNPGPVAKVPDFLFACAPSTLLQKGLPRNVQGVAGIGHAPIALPIQLASHFGFRPNFGICLSSSTNNNGVIFFGEGPFSMLSGVQVSGPVGYTPLIITRQGEYYIQVTSVKINKKPLPINTTLLTTNKQGLGGTMISTTTPYTILEHSIYQTFTKFFTSQFPGVPRVQNVPPFSVCYDSKRLSSTRVGPRVPNIDLVFNNAAWTIFGANSMVQARPGVSCLAFVEGGLKQTRASIVIGAHQIEDNFLQFDLASSRLGFSSSLLLKRSNCGNFNFTTTHP